MKLYGYWRSSSSWRVRIALAFKEIPYEYVAVNLLEHEQDSGAHHARNPAGKVPVLEVDGVAGPLAHLAESMAIIQYLEERWPHPTLLPHTPELRARCRMLAELVNSGTQPFQNLSVMRHVKSLGADPKAFAAHFIAAGLAAYEEAVQATAGAFSVGEAPTLADLYLVPQLYGARRNGVDLSKMPTLLAIEQACAQHPAFLAAHPDRQPDAKPDAK